MIYFLFGKDTYRLRQKMNGIIEEYKKVHKNGLSLKLVDLSKKEDNICDLRNDMRQASMFKEKKMVVIGNAFLDNDIEKKVLDEIKNINNSDDLFLFFQEGEVKKSYPLFKFLDRNGKCQNFQELSGIKLKNWAENQITKYGGKISQFALSKLLLYAGNDLWRLDNEIKKLVSFKNKGQIGIEDIDLLVRSKIETDIFKTIDAISQKDKKTALSLLHKHLDKGDSPLYLLSMVNYQFRNLVAIKDLVKKGVPYSMIAKRSGLHPYVVRKNSYPLERFSMDELKKIYQKIFQADLDIKTGKTDPEVALDLLISEI